MSYRHGLFCLVSLLILVNPLFRATGNDDVVPGPVAVIIKPQGFEPLPLGSIKPAGWLGDQLRLQAAGLGGHLDEFWPDIKDSAWFGGKSEGWERVPYWLDGVVPLAYVLDDEAQKAKVRKAIDAILERQQADGWLGPVGDSQQHQPYDIWPLFPLFKALTQYQEATGDPRIIPALLRCCRKIDHVISHEPIYRWAKVRAADLAVTLYWLSDRTHEAWLLILCQKVFTQSHDWRAMFEHYPFTTKAREVKDLENHGVNTAMGLKYGGVRYRLTGVEKDRFAIFEMLNVLDRYHGQVTGIFTCDEHLAGRSPSQGTELCTIVEAMYSLEVLAAIQGNLSLGDRLESLAYNALPATFKKDMTAHQYDQQCNQVICSSQGAHVYTSNGPESNLFGLEPNFGCCTANMHQGWPKFVSHLWMKTRDGGLAAIAYAPCVVTTRLQGNPVNLTVTTDYPFRGEIAIAVTVAEPMTFPLHLRIPTWADPNQIMVRGTNVQVASNPGSRDLAVTARWSGTQTVTVGLPMPVRLYLGYKGSVAIERGPLVYALPIAADWRKFRERENLPFDDWEVYPISRWNYTLQVDRAHPERSIVFEERAGLKLPFSVPGARVIARVKGRALDGWGQKNGAAAPPPPSSATSAQPLEELTLIPYGCTDLRITEFPTLPSY
jgi:hypothetical protein